MALPPQSWGGLRGGALKVGYWRLDIGSWRLELPPPELGGIEGGLVG